MVYTHYKKILYCIRMYNESISFLLMQNFYVLDYFFLSQQCVSTDGNSPCLWKSTFP